MRDLRLKVLKYAKKIMQDEKDKWLSGFKNEWAQAEDVFKELEEFYERKGIKL